jgi:hypothetical protein
MEIRDAMTEDAPAACDVLRRSISELCVADHGNDPTILARWLSNKTEVLQVCSRGEGGPKRLEI